MTTKTGGNAVFIPPPEKIFNDNLIITEDDYQKVVGKIKEKSGINLGNNKMSMVQARLSKRIRDLSLQSYHEYLNYLESNDEELSYFINALTTNKTDFFREPEHFDFIKDIVVPDCLKLNKKRLMFWSAASSTGEEAYTLAMILKELDQVMGFDFRILATDIDTEVLERAETGIYAKEVVKVIRPDRLQRFFTKGSGDNIGKYKVTMELKNHIKFRLFNLMNSPVGFGLRFDVIFLRNVLIYFADDLKEKVINNLYSVLDTGGYLLIGHSESVLGLKHNYKLISPSIYKKV